MVGEGRVDIGDNRGGTVVVYTRGNSFVNCSVVIGPPTRGQTD